MGGTVGVDVLHRLPVDPRIFDGCPHHPRSTVAGGIWSGDVVGIARHTVTQDLGVDGGPATARGLHLFENQDARPLAEHKTIAAFVPGPGGLLRLVIAGGEGTHGAEASKGQGGDHRFGTPGNHGVGHAELNLPEGIPHRVQPGGASGGGGRIGPFGSELYRYLPRRQIDDEGRNEERGNPTRPTILQDVTRALDHRQPADARTDDHTRPMSIAFVDHEAGITHGELGGRQGIVDEGCRSS